MSYQIADLLAKYDMNEENVTTSDYIQLVKTEPFFVIMAVACNKNTDLYDTKMDLLEDFDIKLRPSVEALIIHAWYCDLWVSTHTRIVYLEAVLTTLLP